MTGLREIDISISKHIFRDQLWLLQEWRDRAVLVKTHGHITRLISSIHVRRYTNSTNLSLPW